MKVLHTLSRVAPSASELTETLDLVAALQRLDVENAIAASEDNLPGLAARLAGLDVPLFPLRFPRGARLGNLHDARQLRKLAADYDLVHAHLSHDHWLAGLATRKPLVRTRHTLARARGHAFNRWLFVRRTAALIGISHRALVSYGVLGVPMSQMHVIPGGVDGKRFRRPHRG